MIDALIYRDRSDARLRAEVLALRHQLRVLERQTSRPRCQPTDHLLLAAISRVLPRPSWRSLLPSPETLLRWHRELVQRKWAAHRRRTRRRGPAPRCELHELIVRLARENSGWGFRRIQGELLKLGQRCSHQTVQRVLRPHGVHPAPRRSKRSRCEFVHQHADKILACDFFTFMTAWLDRLHRDDQAVRTCGFSSRRIRRLCRRSSFSAASMAARQLPNRRTYVRRGGCSGVARSQSLPLGQ